MLKPKEVSQILGVSVKTLQRWDAEGKLIARRNAHNRRFYYEEDIEVFQEKHADKLELISLKGLTVTQKELIYAMLAEFRGYNNQV